jgi:hypothetical protein
MLQIRRIDEKGTLEVTMTWFWMNIPLASLFFLAWTLIPLWMVFKHPDTGRGIPAGEEHPAGHAAAAMPGSAPAYGPPAPALPADRPHDSREEVLVSHR